jgi:hypothetical protein
MRGVSEVVGTIILVGVVMVGVAFVGILLLSNPTPTAVPAFDCIISNNSRTVYIYHKGGDPLYQGQYTILVDGGDQTTNFTNTSPGTNPWTIGETLSNTTPNMPKQVVIVFNQGGMGGGGSIIGSANLYGAVGAGSIHWYNCNWPFREPLTVTTGASAVSSGYSVSVTLNHAALVSAGKSLANGNDLRVMYWSGTSWTELSRALDPLSSWNSASTKIWFPLAAGISASSSDSNYYLYYGNPSAGSPPANWANVFRVGDEFNDGTLTSTLTTSMAGTCTISETGGDLYIDMGTNETDAGIVVSASPLPASKQFAIRHKTKFLSIGGNVANNPEMKGLGIYQLATQPGVTTSALENPRRIITMFERYDLQSWIFYNTSAGVFTSWNGSPLVWKPSIWGMWGTLPLNTYYIYEIFSDGTSWWTQISDANGNVLVATTAVTWANTRNDGNPYWFYWGDPYTDPPNNGYYYGDQKSDWVYMRDYVSPEPTTSIGSESAWNC